MNEAKIYQKLIKNYWLEKLANRDSAMGMPGSRDDERAIQTARLVVYPATAARIQSLANHNPLMEHVVYLTIYGILLHKYFRPGCVLVASPTLRQPSAPGNHLVFYTLPGVNDQATLKQLLKDTLREVQESVKHQDFDYEELMGSFRRITSQSAQTLWQAGFAYDKLNDPTSDFDQIPLQLHIDTTGTEPVIVVQTAVSPEQVHYARQLAAHYHQLLTAVFSPEQTVGEMSMLSQEERDYLLKGLNDTRMAYPKDQTLPELIEAQVSRSPEAIALSFGDRQWSYVQLNARANQLAAYLREKHSVRVNDLVAVAVDRSEWMPVVLLGILKAGAAYVPIDKTYPPSRIHYLLEDSTAPLLITDGIPSDVCIRAGCQVLVLEEILAEVSAYAEENRPAIHQPADLAYVIYTSGSTGQPKGVQISHASVVAFIHWAKSEFSQSPFDVVFAGTSYCFDLSVYELFFTLSAGKRIRLLNDNLEIGAYLEREEKILLNTVPSVVDALLKEKADLSRVTVLNMAGEPIPLRIKEGLDCNRMEVRNLYGPSEDTTYSSCYRLRPEDVIIPIGKPIANTRFYVLDPAAKLVPLGMVGEIGIAGDGLANGYLNKPELTAEKFVANPFEEGERLYRTGDLGRWLPDGNLEFLGRKDHQVKIRGYRVELGEIENALLQYEAIHNAVVIAREDRAGQPYVAAYFTECSRVDLAQLRECMRASLPAYMLPSYILCLEKFPLNANGKIDRKALPDPESQQVRQQPYVAPFNPTQEQLVQIWEEVLGKTQIGIHDNFFELGGHSLKAMRILSAIYKKFDTKISLRTIFINLTVERLAAVITASEKSAYEAIVPVAIQADYPVSHAQKRLWILDQMEQSRLAYHISQINGFEGHLDAEALQGALQQLVERHEILRTTFGVVDGEVRQRVHPDAARGLGHQYIDLREQADAEEVVQRMTREADATPFDLENGPLLRTFLFQLDEEKFAFFFSMHHIITDGWSIDIFMKELFRLYEGYLSNGTPLSPPALRIQYKDFAAWQNEQLRGENGEKHRQYWHHQFREAIPVLELPTDFPRPATKTYHGDDVQVFLEKELVDRLQALGQPGGANLFILLVAALKALLYRYTGQPDVVVGSPIAGREHEDLANQIGFYVNTLALKTRVEGKESFAQLLDKVRETVWGAFEHQVYPFDQLLDDLDLDRDRSRSPLFDVMAMYVNSEEKDHGLVQGDLGGSVVSYGSPTTVSKFDLTVNFVEAPEGLRVVAIYNTDIFKNERIGRLLQHYRNLLVAAVNDPQAPLYALNIVSDEERRQIIPPLHANQAHYAKDKTIQELVEQQVATSPGACALVWEEQALTYQELDASANQLAHYLRESCGINPGDLVGLMVDRTTWMIIGMLSILKSGAAYVPIDKSYPEERIRYILRDSAVKTLLLDDVPPVEVTDAQAVYLTQSLLAGYSNERPVLVNQPNDLAYVIYTSGSTGQPKGVEILHRNAVAFLCWAQTEFADSVFETVFAVTSYCFDLSIFEVFFSLSVGKKIRLLKSGLEISGYLEQEAQILLNTVPSVVDALLKEKADWSAVTVLNMAGEPIPRCVKEGLDCNRMEVRNLYGPSEDTTYSSCYRLRPEDVIIPIGKPIANTRFYLVDAHFSPVPVGIPGEICIAGDGLANGYLNKPELTRQKFVANPFEEGERLYLTGDLGKWMEDGNVEFLGRKDHQVKIRGYRIELGEIESVLLKHEAVKDIVVVAKEDQEQNKYLAAYFTGNPVNSQELRAHVGKHLPGYMVPSFFIYLPNFPLTPNGKIDWKALPDPGTERGNQRPAFVAASSATEKQLVTIWSELLGRENFGVTDHFFEIGGHSLKAMRVLAAVYQTFEVKISLRQFFVNPNIHALAQLIEGTQKTAYEAISPVEPQEYYEVSHALKRMWIIDQLDEGTATYNMPSAYVLKGALNKTALEKAFYTLVDRHEMLRSTFKLIEGEPRQQVHALESYPFGVVQVDLRESGNADEVARELAQQEAHAGFHLAQGPLFQVTLLQLQDTEHLLLLTMHHIISDGWSMEVIFKDVIALYEAYCQNLPNPLPPLGIQFKDYSAWQNRQLSGNRLLEHETYWLNQFAGELPVLHLPLDFPRPAAKTFQGASASIPIEPELFGSLKEHVQAQGSSLFITVLALVKILLYKYSGQQDIIIGTPIAGREHPELENQIGFFVNTLAMRTTFKETHTFDELLRKVKETVLGAFEHQLYPFDQLVEKMDAHSDPSRTPLFDVMVLLQNMSAVSAEAINHQITSEELTVANYGIQTQVSKFDLIFSFHETPEEMVLSLNYNTDLFAAPRIEQMLQHFKVLLLAILADPNRSLNKLVLFSHQEKEAWLQQINWAKETGSDVIRPKDAGRKTSQETVSYVAPANVTEAALLRLWQPLLVGEKVGVLHNFFEVGGHSLKAVRLLSLIYQEFPAATIGLKDIFDHPTIRGLVAVLYEGKSGKNPVIGLNRFLPDCPYLFLIPPIIGSSTVYQPLALALEGTVNCCGMQYKGFDYQEVFEPSIAVMAHSFVRQVLKRQPEGVVHVLGYSMGAAIAFEMTRLLEDQGRMVQLILLDHTAVERHRNPAEDRAALQVFLQTEFDFWLKDTALPNPDRIRRLLIHNYQLLSHHRLSGTISANVMALEASENYRDHDMNHWENYTSGFLEHAYLEGDHFDVLSTVNLPLIASKIKDAVACLASEPPRLLEQ